MEEGEDGEQGVGVDLLVVVPHLKEGRGVWGRVPTTSRMANTMWKVSQQLRATWCRGWRVEGREGTHQQVVEANLLFF